MTVQLLKSLRNNYRNTLLTSSSLLALSASILWKGLRDAVSSTFLSFSAFCRRCLQQNFGGKLDWRENQTCGGKIKLVAGTKMAGKLNFTEMAGELKKKVKNNSLGL
jgi:hypothetical protein